MIRNRWLKFGYASVNFGTPLSARAWCNEQNANPAALTPEARAPLVEKLAAELMHRVGHLVPVLPVPLVAEAVLAAPEGISEFDLKASVYRRIEALQQQGAVVIVPSRTRVFTIDTAFNMLKLRHLVIEDHGRYRAAPDAGEVLAYYANSLAVWPTG
jgi:glycerol-3-phosphate O-acyltransferase